MKRTHSANGGTTLTLIVLLSALLCILPACTGCGTATRASTKNGFGNLKVPTLGERVLVIAPHPDDEVLASAGLIERCVQRNVKVKVVIVTCGDGSSALVEKYTKKKKPGPADFREIGVIRHGEALSAAKELGLNQDDVIFLCYPDGGINSLWSVNWDYDRLHSACNGSTQAPYPFAYQRNAPYCGQNLVNNLQAIIKDYQPTAIVYPSQKDVQHDHWAVNAFVKYALINAQYQTQEYTYLVHRYDFPHPEKERPKMHLYPPMALGHTNTTWKTLTLSRNQEAAKESAIHAYSIPILIKRPFFESFVRRNELYGIEHATIAKRVGGSPPDLMAENMPDVVILDTVGDATENTFGNRGGLKAASLAVGDKEAYLGLETNTEILSGVVYAFHLRIFRGETVDRLDIHVEGGSARTLVFAENSMRIKPINTRIKANRLWLEIPASIFNDCRECMMSVDAIVGSRRSDRTAWQRIKLE